MLDSLLLPCACALALSCALHLFDGIRGYLVSGRGCAVTSGFVHRLVGAPIRSQVGGETVRIKTQFANLLLQEGASETAPSSFRGS